MLTDTYAMSGRRMCGRRTRLEVDPSRYRALNDMDEGGGEESRDQASPRGESALGDLAQLLVENPWMNQALQVAFGVRERASRGGHRA